MIQGLPELPSGFVTFVFTDIEGSTRLLRELGTRFEELLAQHHALLRSAFQTHGGVEVKTVGDAFFLAFPDASSAIAAAHAGQLALSSYPWPKDAEIKVRMGIHSGDADARDGDYVALAVNQAARIASVAHGGQIVVSEITARAFREHLVEGLSLRDLGRFRVRDFEEPIRLLQVVHPSLPDAFPPPRVTPVLATNLPRFRTNFYGRERVIETLRGQVVPQRLVTLVGPGGVGKTRTAVQALSAMIDRFEGGVWFVDLAALAGEDEVLPAIAAVLRSDRDDDINAAIAARVASDTVLVLDNCEHVLAQVAKVADELLLRVPRLAIVATSREALGLSDEIIHRLQPLPIPAAGALDEDALMEAEGTRLFIDRASTIVPDFSIGPNAAAIAEVVARLDGIPLAVEIAAARLSEMSLDVLCARLIDHLAVVRRSGRAASPRHRTLDALIGWSYDLLGNEEARSLRALSVFAAWFDETMVAEMFGRDAVVGDLWALVDASLLVVEETDQRPRFRLLETIRAYAWRKLAERPEEADAVVWAHLSWCASLAERSSAAQDEVQEEGWRPTITAHVDDLQAALSRARDRQRHDLALTLTLGICQYAEGISKASAISMLERALADELAPSLIRARALRLLAWLEYSAGQERRTAATAEAALSLARRFGDPLLEARCLHVLGNWARGERIFDQAERCFEQALAIGRREGATEMIVSSLLSLGGLANIRDQLEQAEQAYGEAYVEARASGRRMLIASSLAALDGLAYRRGDLKAAYDLAKNAGEAARLLGSRRMELRSFIGRGFAAAGMNDLEVAQADLEEALRLAREIESRSDVTALIGLASCHRRRGDLRRCVEYLREGFTLEIERQGYPSLGQLTQVGLLAVSLGDRDRGRSLIADSWYQAESYGVRFDGPEKEEVVEALGDIELGDSFDMDQATAIALDILQVARAELAAVGAPSSPARDTAGHGVSSPD